MQTSHRMRYYGDDILKLLVFQYACTYFFVTRYTFRPLIMAVGLKLP